MTKIRRPWTLAPIARYRVYQCLNGRCPAIVRVGHFPLCPACRLAIWIGIGGAIGVGMVAGAVLWVAQVIAGGS